MTDQQSVNTCNEWLGKEGEDTDTQANNGTLPTLSCDSGHNFIL